MNPLYDISNMRIILLTYVCMLGTISSCISEAFAHFRITIYGSETRYMTMNGFTLFLLTIRRPYKACTLCYGMWTCTTPFWSPPF